MAKEYERAREAALKLLDIQDRTSYELRGKLKKKGFSETTIDEVLARLTESELIDDSRYASLFIRTKTEAGKGSIWIRHKLAEKGIPSDTISLAFEEFEGLGEGESEELRCLRKALAVCGLTDRFDVDENGELVQSQEYTNCEPVNWFGRRIPKGEIDRNNVRKLRERERASLVRKLVSSGFHQGAAFSAASKIEKL